jgi:SAM-dependent methyltransferase
MDKQLNVPDGFYERFWADSQYQQAYAFDSAVRDRFPAVRKVWGDLLKPGAVLDFGCGNGVLTYWLKCNGFGDRIIGVDVSKTGVENARKAFGRPGLTYELAGYVDELGPDSFDVVVSSHVLEHIEQPEAVMRKIASKAEWLVLEVPLEKCLWPEISCLLRGKSRKDNPLGHVNFWCKQTFNDLLKDEGLLVVRDYHYASAPYSPFNHWAKRLLERVALSVLGLNLYSKVMATHYIVLARRISVNSVTT